ncbi:MAG TPA: prolyl oligopeptidase family serine peptidase [Acidimicrobiales bacterium]|nr:prolyl oligopeptidase family serine peptidase [Acidimicrobiales bacterium]
MPDTVQQMLSDPNPGSPEHADSWRDAIPPTGIGVQAVALLDVELRTAVASLVSLSAIPATLLRGGGDHRAAAEFYADLARTRDVDSLFPRPPSGVPVRNRTIARLRYAPAVTDVESLSFISPYQVTWPMARERFEAHSRNAIARAMHWRHDDGPRPTIIFVHGFTGSPYRFNSEFFQLPWYYRHGCDVVLAVLPFHGRRNDLTGPFDGSGLFSDGMATFSEAMLQSVTDLRVIIDYLESTGVDKIGITGLSLGGYVTALMAGVEERLQFAIPNCAVTDLATLMDGWFPAGPLIGAGLRLGRLDRRIHDEAMRLHSPLRLPARIPRDRLFVIGGLADRLAPPEQSARLWDHWGRPRLHWFPGSHILHLRRAVYLREIGRFLRDTGFSPG